MSSAKQRHEETWTVLPWLANDRLSGVERERAEEHVRVCDECTRELAAQRSLCDALSAPERVTYAPGPSFRKLLERIDEAPRVEEPTAAPRSEAISVRGRGRARTGHAALWRPPGLAWAASFIVMVGMTAMVATGYRWSEARYQTRTDSGDARPQGILHIALDRDLTIGEVEELLRADGARVVEGPGTTGIFGIAPVAHTAGQTTDQQLRRLATRLRADPRVRWVEPIDMDSPDQAAGRGP